ncbi:DUF2997 domain-containing protein [Nostoc sp. XA013]|nr:DUF2997 domain-containing protein [Nostoc sp. XA013]
MERSVLIHFDSATGEVKVEALGFEGLTCLSATQPFEEALGVVAHIPHPKCHKRKLLREKKQTRLI